MRRTKSSWQRKKRAALGRIQTHNLLRSRQELYKLNKAASSVKSKEGNAKPNKQVKLS